MAVQLILKEDISSLGKAGELVSVRPGYARNYLIPNGTAILATLQNLLWLKEHKSKLEEEAEAKRKVAQSKKEILESLGEIVLSTSVGPTGKLFGRITNRLLSEQIFELSSEQLALEPKNIRINEYPHGIDELGNYSVDIDFGASVKAKLSLAIVSDS